MSVINQMLRDLDARTAPAGSKGFADRLRLQPSAGVPKWRTAAASCIVVGGAIYVGHSLTTLWDERATRSSGPAASAAPILASPASQVIAPAPDTAAAPTADTPAPAPTPASAPTGPASLRHDVPAPKSIDAMPARPPVDPRVHASEAVPQPVATKIEAAPAPVPVALRSQAPAASLPTPIDPYREPEPRPVAPPRTEVPRLQLPAPLPVTAGPTQIDKKFTSGNGARTPEDEYRRAAQFISQGRLAEAQTSLRNVLDLEPGHEAARQALAALLIEARSLDVAQGVLAEGLQRNPGQVNFALALARLKFEHGDVASALELLRDHARHASGHPEYRAFHAALLARQRQHADAVIEYEAALRMSPGVGAWWLGLAMSREALGQTDSAIDAFRRARLTRTLTANLEDLVERKLRGAP